MEKNVVVLSSRSLFSAGVIRRLEQHLQGMIVNVIDPQSDDAFVQIIRAQPSAIIVVDKNLEKEQNGLLIQLLDSLPILKIIRLDLQHSEAQIVTMKRQVVNQFSDLIGIIAQPIVILKEVNNGSV